FRTILRAVRWDPHRLNRVALLPTSWRRRLPALRGLNLSESSKPAATYRALKPRGTLASAIAIGLLFTAYFVGLALKNTVDGVNSDGIVYLFLAQHLGFGAPIPEHLAAHLLEQFPFPPLFSVLLGLCGGGIDSPSTSFVVGSVFLGSAAAIFFALLRAEGATLAGAFFLTALWSAIPSTVFVAFGVFSETLYLALCLAVFFALRLTDISTSAWLGAAILVALATLTRSAGMVLLVSYLLVLWRGAPRPSLAWQASAVALLPIVGWNIFKSLNGWSAGYASIFLDGAVQWFESPLVLVQRLSDNLGAITYHTHRSFDFLSSDYSAIAVVFLLLPAMITLRRRLRHWRIDALYLVGSLALLLVWPFPNDMQRFLFPLLPIFVAYAFDGFGSLVPKISSGVRQGVYLLIALVAVCAIAPSTVSVLSQIKRYANTPHQDWVRTSAWYRYLNPNEAIAAFSYEQQIHAAVKAVLEGSPDTACISTTYPAVIYVQGRRASLPPPLPSQGKARLIAHFEACPWVLGIDAVPLPPMGYANYYPLTHGGDLLRVVRTAPRPGPADPGSRPLAILARYGRE
ncbi:MAG: hypothetical protein AAF384_07650, partial [Pseudomonadota bacterium]